MNEIRLQKAMADAGVTSRRKSEELILAGHVKVNGKKVSQLGTKVSPHDEIMVDGIPVEREKLVYYLLYKPRSVITSVKDEKNRVTVMTFFPDVDERIYPVGRLDYDTSGAVLMTNDGELANQLMHPKFKMEKTYQAKVRGIVTPDDLKRLEAGVVIDRRKTAKAKASLISTDNVKKTSLVSLTIHEGRNHQVKKMFQVINKPVMKLKRESYGFLNLDGIQPGKWRALKLNEVNRLKQQVMRNAK
ncbi:pseudouridine synthase [Pediococcus claussenii]|uniref:Pseudouridine synthase n=1 Tax=Pediococcus claussenii (strain ATCC BAA-344 / DSM 14800 / JCM 18046 / KCTC 3811 / LMG 21948 / P06) TaxID=701521 RepID=G8PD35_PEDCP|nr:pseudouridine synthase [Pediococcus claussenii]AEV95170.1 ribosomal large subunit pseudouridine synthase B [Pediococcus claussenii ATCC BAA-344]ANZ70403.1 pseudouridine synthase [Pediococcus claussenii]ANZ72219.1 pseudouridine synthase [Pediococcus claussenii]KRN19647.1 rluB protein [Pediococcus claussenii]